MIIYHNEHVYGIRLYGKIYGYDRLYGAYDKYNIHDTNFKCMIDEISVTEGITSLKFDRDFHDPVRYVGVPDGLVSQLKFIKENGEIFGPYGTYTKGVTKTLVFDSVEELQFQQKGDQSEYGINNILLSDRLII